MIDLKKIADEISEKCGVDVRVEHNERAKSGNEFLQHLLWVCIDNNQPNLEYLDAPDHAQALSAAHQFADRWMEGKDDREQAELEAARAIIAKHEGGQQ